MRVGREKNVYRYMFNLHYGFSGEDECNKTIWFVAITIRELNLKYFILFLRNMLTKLPV